MRESCGGPLPPASPCHREPLGRTPDDEGESSSAVFLVGGYAHYNCPYVWVRAGHSLLGSFGTDEQLDAPLLLESTQAWRERTVHAWEIVAELVGAVATPSPINPFELQPGYLEELAPVDAMLLSGSAQRLHAWRPPQALATPKSLPPRRHRELPTRALPVGGALRRANPNPNPNS
eukprot:scaffold133110_cov63-Phaeocystis_antarctica.AAC.8